MNAFNSGWGVTASSIAASVAQAIVASQGMSWAAHISAGAGTYDGQRRRIISGVGNQPFWLEWNATETVWDPLTGQQLFNVGAVQSVTTTDGTQLLTLPTVALPVSFLRGGLGILHDFIAETDISATARALVLTIGTSDYASPAAAANRRVEGRFGFMATASNSGTTTNKKDASEYDFPGSANTNLSTVSETWANALNLTGSITFTTAASSATAKVRRNKLFLVRG